MTRLKFPLDLIDVADRMDEKDAEIKRLRAAFIDAARLLTLEQLQQLSEQSAHVLADIGLLTHEQAATNNKGETP